MATPRIQKPDEMGILRVLARHGADGILVRNLAGAAFLTVIILSNLMSMLRDYRQRLLNTRLMLSLRRSMFDRLLHLPLPKLWDMKTGGILSRLTGDVDATTGLMQLAIVSPTISVLRLMFAIGILLTLNWRLALVALAIIPGAHPFTVTSQFTVTGVMSIMSFAIVLGVGFWKHGIKFFTLFMPHGTPKILLPILFVVELISFMVRRPRPPSPMAATPARPTISSASGAASRLTPSR